MFISKVLRQLKSPSLEKHHTSIYKNHMFLFNLLCKFTFYIKKNFLKLFFCYRRRNKGKGSCVIRVFVRTLTVSSLALCAYITWSKQTTAYT